MNAKLLKQGAEARVYLVEVMDSLAILKERFPKTYRHPQLDQKINSRRIVSEARILAKAYKYSLPVPLLLYVCLQKGHIYMQYLRGDCLKDWIYGQVEANEVNLLQQFQRLGQIIAKMHAIGIIHGDLTTSNIIVQECDQSVMGKLFLIDFGLAFVSHMQEDKAVDLYVLERAIQSTHPQFPFLFPA